ncbi:hypothetical protein D3879_14075 [Pseudomonas cavernicola]|uniref:Uncharacterized protein n=1 Tax=Pseudomonas cavernicola TaxID=2320866 RepID=A0A418XP88_9PSED|nr:hypothetical protein [Pseudomonas cavernicola]RJG14280.1 hypothetical protein D3879_14075 [Pseudomonas cavernicola]
MELTKAILDCMQLLRRRLRQEQALDIRLSQPGAVMSMLAACADSTIDETRELGERLSQLSGLRLAPPPPPVLSEAELIEKYTQYAGPLRG